MSDVANIKEKLDVVDVLREYIELKPAGSSFKGLCPFHNEKSPSFMVNQDRQVWHCFGCSKGGDIFSFVQEIEGMAFVEALRFLAKKAGVELSNLKNDTNTSQRNRLKEINNQAAEFFYKVLTSMEASQEARAYLIQRGVTQDTIDNWQIGFIPQQWDLLTKYFLKKGNSIDDLVASGLTIKKTGADGRTGQGFYDRFRGRIMFPITTAHGEVVGFSGRILDDSDPKAGGKYINTPQTSVYDKSRVLFGLHKAKRAIKDSGIAVVVEGQMDVISSHQAGVENVVASSGTALTIEQLTLLTRYAKTLLLSFDQDPAGQQAALRGIERALQLGIRVKVIQIPEHFAKDPDECITKDFTVWQQALSDAQDFMTWRIALAMKDQDLKDPHTKQEIAETVIPWILRLPSAIERDHWTRELGENLLIDRELIQQEVRRIGKEEHQKNRFTQKVSLEVADTTIDNNSVKISIYDSFWEEIFTGIAKYPELLDQIEGEILVNILAMTQYNSLYETLKRLYTTTDTNESAEPFAGENIEDEHTRKLFDKFLLKSSQEVYDISIDEARREVARQLQQLKRLWTTQELNTLSTKLSRASKENNKQEEQRLLERINMLQQTLTDI